MTLTDREASYLWDMYESAKTLGEFLEGKKYADFQNSKMLQSAVERQLEIIGEAARRIPDDYKKEHPEIVWKSMVALRNILIHEYGEVRIDRVWLIATTSAQELIELLQPLIPRIDDVE